MLSKSVINHFKKLAEDKPNVKTARIIGTALRIPFKKEDFVSMEVVEKQVTDNYDVYGIIIRLKSIEIEITILDYCYFIKKTDNKKKYQFVYQYYYEQEPRVSESFSLDTKKCYINIKNEYPTNSLTIMNNEVSLTRIHSSNDYMEKDNKNVISVRAFINEIEEKDRYECQEVFYFSDPKEMYHFKISNKLDEYIFRAGASLSISRYKLDNNNIHKDEKELFDIVGISKSCKNTYPKIYCSSDYLFNDKVNKVEFVVTKEKNTMLIKCTENGKSYSSVKCQSPDKNFISINDLNVIKGVIKKHLNDRPYRDLLDNYIDELILRITNRQKREISDMASYNCDIFDYYINEGKEIYDIKAKSIEQRGLDLYIREKSLNKLLDGVRIPDINIRKTDGLQLVKKANDE